VTPLYQQKLALTSPTNGGSSVDIIRSRIKATELVSYCVHKLEILYCRVTVKFKFGQSIFVSCTQLSLDSCGSADVGHPLCREVGSVVYSFCWASLMQSFSDPSPEGLSCDYFCNHLQSLLVHSANCVNTYTMACRRVHTSTPL
jgi:hypothetical protein